MRNLLCACLLFFVANSNAEAHLFKSESECTSIPDALKRRDCNNATWSHGTYAYQDSAPEVQGGIFSAPSKPAGNAVSVYDTTSMISIQGADTVKRVFITKHQDTHEIESKLESIGGSTSAIAIILGAGLILNIVMLVTIASKL